MVVAAARPSRSQRRTRAVANRTPAPPLMRRKQFQDHNDVCEECELNGELFMCEYCDIAVHPACVGLEDKEDWPEAFVCDTCDGEDPALWDMERVPA